LDELQSQVGCPFEEEDVEEALWQVVAEGQTVYAAKHSKMEKLFEKSSCAEFS